MWGNVKKVLSLHKKASSSQVFVSVNVTDTMGSHGISRQSTREIIRVGIGSLLIIGLLFISIYTFILAYVDNKFRPSPDHDRSWKYKKIKLIGKKNEFFASTDYESQVEATERKVVWNSRQLYSKEILPNCVLGSVFRIIITSAPKHRSRRQSIRKTWCQPENFYKPHHGWHCVFLISQTQNQTLNEKVEEESVKYNDILIGTFIDSYRNLSLKVVHGFDWVVNHCPSSFIVKTDDDCFVNSGVIHDFLIRHNKISTKLYVGSVIMDKRKLQVIRGDSKWAVSRSDFPQDHYPPYASGVGYVLSFDVAKQLIQETRFIKPIANEDAYVGILISSLGIKPTVSSRFMLSPSGLSMCNFLYVMITHGVLDDFRQRELMQTVLKAKRLCNTGASLNMWN